ncbi:RNA polymerase sigma factor [Paractinoplanes rishiriensis]|uniref:RNA polymerase sigma-70 region 2 domain-containing protein n=1 Tax=Paractinoplanes rishiriensis TaxID=1050105 RepID=A0A919K9R5_9ACTN|nr:sigma-70 family RNA polymerase sigma factor [Actinoplanes rishiriensis]GIF01285.1 hypothetical protein Ari01nite_87490 [Actinoplanes rishiriensis]
MRGSPATSIADRVRAAQHGDREALTALVEDHLDMLYNVAGRALNGHADVDDVVQETLLRVVQNLAAIRDPARFSGWILAIVHREIAERLRRRRTSAERTHSLDLAADLPDPGADFADLIVLRLGLSGQRRQVVEAVRWLEPDDRFLLSLWWLEVADRITRADLVAALGLSATHAAVRVKRMRDQLDLARCIVGALDARPRCPDLGEALATWDERPSPVWRKRLARHLRDCPSCAAHERRLLPPETLLAGVAMLPLPPTLGTAAVSGMLAGPAGYGLLASLAGSAGQVAAAAGAGWAQTVGLSKLAVAVAGAAAIAGGVVAAVDDGDSPAPRPPAAIAPADPPTPSRASTPPVPSAAPSTAAPSVRYGSVVDVADPAPPTNRRPDRLPARPEGTLTITASNDNDPRPDVVSLIHRGESATYRGRGYLRVEFAVAFTERVGIVAMPAWTGLKGKLFHVASGGGRRLDDRIRGAAAGFTGMGDPTHGYAHLPDGAQQMWHFEYYYLDGEVTYTSNERGADYNLYVHIVDRVGIDGDLRTPPAGPQGPIRYGFVRDDATNACPVPQYVTRRVVADTATVPQQSDVG